MMICVNLHPPLMWEYILSGNIWMRKWKYRERFPTKHIDGIDYTTGEETPHTDVTSRSSYEVRLFPWPLKLSFQNINSPDDCETHTRERGHVLWEHLNHRQILFDQNMDNLRGHGGTTFCFSLKNNHILEVLEVTWRTDCDESPDVSTTVVNLDL